MDLSPLRLPQLAVRDDGLTSGSPKSARGLRPVGDGIGVEMGAGMQADSGYRNGGPADSNGAAFFSGRTNADVNQALIGGSSEESSPLSLLTPRGRTLLEASKSHRDFLSLVTEPLVDSLGSKTESEESTDAQSAAFGPSSLSSPKRKGGGLTASWEGPAQSRSLLKESLMAAESRSNGAFGSPLEHPPGRHHPSALRLSHDRLLSTDSPLGTPKIAKGRERHVDSPKDSPNGSHDFGFASGGFGTRHAPLLGSPLGMGQSAVGGFDTGPGSSGVTVFKREAIQESTEPPLARQRSLKKLLSIAIPDSATGDQDARVFDAPANADVGGATYPPKKLIKHLELGGASPREKPLSPLEKLAAAEGGAAEPSSFSTGLTLPTLKRMSSLKSRTKAPPEPLRISDEVRSYGPGKDPRVCNGEPISGGRVSDNKRAQRKEHVTQPIVDGFKQKSFSGVDSLTQLSRSLKGGSSPKGSLPKKTIFTEESSSKMSTETHDGGAGVELVAEVARAKPANSSPWRPLDQQGTGCKVGFSGKKGGREKPEEADPAPAGPSKPDGADVTQEQKHRQQQEEANGAQDGRHPHKAPREQRSDRRSGRMSVESDDSGGDKASPAPHGLPTDRDWTWSDFKVRREVGVGRYSTVYQAEVRTNQFPVALKMYHQKKMDSYVENQVRREIRLHGRVHHKYISEIYGHFEDKEGNICLVLEWAPLGDVFEDRRKSKGPLSEERAVKEVVQPLMFALQYMHKQGIIHRDIKPENILVFPNKRIKLADFGFAIDLNEQRPCTRLGTTDYMAPEIIAVDDEHRDREKGNYDMGVDAWAVGILAYELLTGRPPFQADSRKETYALIRKGDVVIPSYLSTEAASFILTALTRNPHRRPGVVQLLHHPWILTHGVRSTHRRSYSHSPVRSRHGSVAKADSFLNTEPIVSSPTAEDGARAKRAPKNKSLGADMLSASHSTTDLAGLAKKSALRAVVGDSFEGVLAGFKHGEGGLSMPSSPKAGEGEPRTPHYMSSLKGVMKNAFSRSKSQKDMMAKSKPGGLMSRMTSKQSNIST